MNRKKYFILIAFILIGASVFAYVFAFKSNHRNIAEEEATIVLKATELHNPFKNNRDTITGYYVDKVALITGSITAMTGKTLELDYMIQVDLTDSLTTVFDKGEIITVKGRCVGYDDLLEVVKIDQALITQ